MIRDILLAKVPPERKIGKAKSPRNCSGRTSGRNPPSRGGGSKIAKLRSSELMILGNTSTKVTILENTSQTNVVKSRNRKIGKRKAIVIAAGENQTEIHPLGTEAQNGKISKNGDHQK